MRAVELFAYCELLACEVMEPLALIEAAQLKVQSRRLRSKRYGSFKLTLRFRQMIAGFKSQSQFLVNLRVLWSEF